ncbi:MAG: hypothetical protein J2P36_14060 [Ktedonobacteraceae bacterium]|nr:hypothetical protein [Ktedonobacteraceae bacterium]
MSNAEKHLVLVTVSLALVALSIAFLVMVFTMPHYAGAITWIFVALVTLIILASVTRSLNEQFLRHKRVRHLEEVPLNRQGTPYYMPDEMRVYPQEHIATHGHWQPEQRGYDGDGHD